MNFENNELDSIEFVGLDDFEDDYESEDEEYLTNRRNRNFSNHCDNDNNKKMSCVLTTAALTTSTGTIDTCSSRPNSISEGNKSKTSSFQELCSPVSNILHHSSTCLRSPISDVCDYVSTSVSAMSLDSILRLERDAKDRAELISKSSSLPKPTNTTENVNTPPLPVDNTLVDSEYKRKPNDSFLRSVTSKLSNKLSSAGAKSSLAIARSLISHCSRTHKRAPTSVTEPVFPSVYASGNDSANNNDASTYYNTLRTDSYRSRANSCTSSNSNSTKSLFQFNRPQPSSAKSGKSATTTTTTGALEINVDGSEDGADDYVLFELSPSRDNGKVLLQSLLEQKSK